MAYQAIYRKWRPVVFEDVVGQSHITETLKNQLNQGRTSHAYLFCGTRGTGKTTAAKIFSRAVNCRSPKNGSPCNECEICRGILDGSIMDVFEIDAASNNGVDNIREIIEDSKYVATEAKYRVYIIDEVHMLSGGAFNALLKTLEEPPPHVIFILATTEAHKVPQTILSRCQRFDFKRIAPSDIIRRMREIAMGDELSITDEAYELLARLADGSMRDGLSILERCISQVGTSLTHEKIISVLGIAGSDLIFRTVDYINAQDCRGILEVIDSLMSDGKDLHIFIDNLIEHYRNLMVCKVTDQPETLLSRDAQEIIRLKAQAENTTFERLSAAVYALSQARTEAKWVKEPRVIYELSLIKLTRPELDSSNDAILERLADLEDKIKNGVPTTAVPQEYKAEPEEKPKKKEPSARLFVPVDKDSLSPDTPSVMAARKWDKTAQAIVRKFPHLHSTVMGRKVTVDGEGVILLYDKSEIMLKKMASTFLSQISEMVCSAIGSQIIIKTAFSEDIEGNIVDFWNLGPPESVSDSDKSPVDALAEKFPEIVEITDSEEFLEYKPEEDSFSQAEMSDEENEEREEFLEDSEMSDEE